MPTNHTRQSGYALLVTLAMVALSGTILASVATQSLSRVGQANRAQQDLQRRWGAFSIRHALAPNAPELLADAYTDYLETWVHQQSQSSSSPKQKTTVPLSPPRTLHLKQRLGKIDFTILIRDESARLNANTLYENLNSSSTKTRQAIATMIGHSPFELGLKINPYTPPKQNSSSPTPRPLGAFSQLFPNATPDDLIGHNLDDTGLISNLTLFSTGRLNTRLASLKALKATLKPILSTTEISKILKLLDTQPAADLKAITERLSPTSARKLVASDILTLTTNTHSLWIVADDGRKRQHRWIVTQQANPLEPTLEFIW